MNPERWRKVTQAMGQFLELPSADQVEFLERLRNEDADLGSEVASLLHQHITENLDALPPQLVEEVRHAGKGKAPPGEATPPSTDSNGLFDLLASTGDYRAEGNVAGKPSASGDGERFPEIPGYDIAAVLGRGGMGVVYLALDTELKRRVALKMLPAGLDDSGHFADRFRSEAEAVAQLHHPNIVQVYGIGEHDGQPYFSQELIEGGNLAKHIAGAPQSPQWAAAPDGIHLASTEQSGILRVWEITSQPPAKNVKSTWTKPKVFQFQGARCSKIVFAPDGRQLAVACSDGAVCLISMKQPNDSPVTVLAASHGAVTCFDFSWDGTLLATASHDTTVKLWDSRTRKLLRSFSTDGLNWCVAVSPDRKYVASGSGVIHVWEADTGRLVHKFHGHTRLIMSLAFNPREPMFVSCSSDGTVRLWDYIGRRPLGVLAQFKKSVLNLSFRPDGQWLAAACHDGRVALWDFTNETLQRTLDPGKSVPLTTTIAPARLLSLHNGPVWSVAFSGDGNYLASGSQRGPSRIGGRSLV